MTYLNKYRLVLKEEKIEYVVKNSFNTPEEIADFANEHLGLNLEPEECVYCFCFDNAMHPLGFFELSHGTDNASLVSIKQLFKRVLLLNSSRIVLLHNHPSANLTPSSYDISITNKIKSAGDLLEIEVLDHIIVSPTGEWYSFKENGGIK